MIILKRNIQTDEIATASDNMFLCKCQASFNSDGNITLRNYNRNDNSEDEIMILSKTETNAIFELMYKISENTKNRVLPF